MASTLKNIGIAAAATVGLGLGGAFFAANDTAAADTKVTPASVGAPDKAALFCGTEPGTVIDLSCETVKHAKVFAAGATLEHQNLVMIVMFGENETLEGHLKYLADYYTDTAPGNYRVVKGPALEGSADNVVSYKFFALGQESPNVFDVLNYVADDYAELAEEIGVAIPQEIKLLQDRKNGSLAMLDIK